MEGDACKGKLHGHQTAWYDNGQKKGEGEYRDDVQMPGWKDWDETGQPIITNHPGE
jgi:antitoxin component YwqK of YwqJK toxin-antitoxin module